MSEQKERKTVKVNPTAGNVLRRYPGSLPGRNVLSRRDRERFALLRSMLVYYAYRVIRSDGITDMKRLKDGTDYLYNDESRRDEAAQYLWTHTELIDRFVEQNEELTKLEREILLSWKRAKTGIYTMVDYTEDGAIVFGMDAIYQVLGIERAWGTFLGSIPLPMGFDGTLLPYRGRIITDGRLTLNPIEVPEEFLVMTMGMVQMARAENGILTSL